MSLPGAALLQPGSLQQALTIISRQFEGLTDTPTLEAQLLTAYVIEKPRSWLLAHPEANLDARQISLLTALVRRRQSGEPLPYLLGRWGFFGLDFSVRPGVLIPRPETEILVETALTWLRQTAQPAIAIDVGTGSGCIAVSLALNVPAARFFACDISSTALEVARENLRRYQLVDAIHLLQSDLLAPFPCQVFNLICANLPYIPSQTLRSLVVYGKEPSLALDGGPDGMLFIKQLIFQARQVLAPDGLILLEIEAGQGLAVSQYAKTTFPEAAVTLRQDLAGRDRLVEIQT